MANKKPKLACISLIGELADWGKHVLLKDAGITICGCFTVDYDKERFKNMPPELPSEYKHEEWDITCKKCIEIFEILEAKSKSDKAKLN